MCAGSFDHVSVGLRSFCSASPRLPEDGSRHRAADGDADKPLPFWEKISKLIEAAIDDLAIAARLSEMCAPEWITVYPRPGVGTESDLVNQNPE